MSIRIAPVLHHFNRADLVTDSALAAWGFLPSALTQIHVALILGVLNLLIVVAFRALELVLRERRTRHDAQRERELRELQERLSQYEPVTVPGKVSQ